MFRFLFRKLDNESFDCDVCEFVKYKRSTFPTSNNKRSPEPFHLIHSDIWGPFLVLNIFVVRWFVSFIDDCTTVVCIFLLKHKSDISFVLPNFHNMIKTSLMSLFKGFGSTMPDYFN